MKSLKLLALALCVAVFASCNGGGDAQQQPVAATPNAQEQMAPQPAADTTMASQQVPQQAPAQTAALPEPITTFLKQYFPGATVAGVETDNEYGGLEYDVYLNDGTEVDFDARNQWEKVDCHTKAVPAALVPSAIASYVKANYQSLPITKIDNNRYGYDIELSNGLELKFNANGQFMGIDD